MATISSLGIGSGLDANSIISKLVALEKAPLTALQVKATAIQARISAFGTVQSQFSALNDAAQAMKTASAWTSTKTSSSNSSAATMTATSSTSPTSFTLDVDALAQAQSVSSTTLTAGAPVGAGTMTLRLGSWSSGGAAFTPATGSSDVAIAITASDTVATIASKINAANAGVTATPFNDGTSDRLLIRSNSTGAANGFRIQVADADGLNTDDSGLSRLAFDPATLNPATSATYGMAASGIPVQYGSDAKARINGLAVTSASNTLTGNIPGVTINLLTTTTTNYGTGSEVRSPLTMTVSSDTSGAVKMVQSFVGAYNALAQTLRDDTKYDSSTQTAGPFQGDSVITGMQSLLSNMLTSVSNSGGVYQRLSDIGVSVQQDGTLTINSVKLGTAANNGTELQKLFTSSGASALKQGFALKFAAFTQGAIAFSGGLITNQAKALQGELTNNSDEQSKVTQRADAVQARLVAQYSALDAKMGSLSALSAYVNQQITLWNKSTSNN